MKSIATFEDARLRAHNFCADREWSKFHTPTNIVLALSGECGEVSEIFQWKGCLEGKDVLEVFTEKEIKHIGEELADVFIYSTRLCDICNIDLPAFVRSCAGLPASGPVWSTNINSLAIWSNLSFDDLHKSSRLNVRSVRELVLELHLEVGRICELFNSRSETMNRYGLVDWTDTERNRLSTTIATVCMILATIADMVKLSLASCITDKFAKNDAKYPVDLVRGKSGKYTEYVEKIKQQQKSFVARAFENAFSNNNLNVLLLCCLSIACGYIGGKRTMMNM